MVARASLMKVAPAKRVAVAAASAVLVALAGEPWFAQAHHMNVRDPNDTKGPLDIRRIETGPKPLRPHWKIVTFSGWNAQRIFDRGFFVIHLDLRGDDFYEHYVLVRSNGKGLRAHLYRDRKNKPAFVVRRVGVWRPNEKTLSVRFPIDSRVGKNRTEYRWYVTSLMSNNKCRQVCIDRVPDDGAVREPLVLSEEPPEPDPTPDR